MTQSAEKPAFTIKGRHVLIALVLFFGLIAAVDGYFISLAVKTFSGQVAKNPYEAGLVYNRTLAQREREAALGWTATVERLDGDVIAVRVSDRAGAPLDGLSVTATLERPATSKGQRTLSFAGAGPGLYRANAAPLDGAWDVHATIRGPGDALFEADRRLVSP
ncbi:MAG: FixH family protein [Caulobacter sp.]|nr:FixH family protein [Caulobacter sp.]